METDDSVNLPTVLLRHIQNIQGDRLMLKELGKVHWSLTLVRGDFPRGEWFYAEPLDKNSLQEVIRQFLIADYSSFNERPHQKRKSKWLGVFVSIGYLLFLILMLTFLAWMIAFFLDMRSN